jgi:hypothetical protein
MSNRKWPKDKNDAYKLLTNAINHCRFGSTSSDRIPDEGDLDAAAVLTKARKTVALEGVNR